MHQQELQRLVPLHHLAQLFDEGVLTWPRRASEQDSVELPIEATLLAVAGVVNLFVDILVS